jgi:hypothetical protein
VTKSEAVARSACKGKLPMLAMAPAATLVLRKSRLEIGMMILPSAP